MRNYQGLIAVVLLVWAGAVSAELRIEQGYVRGLPPGQTTTAAFMRLVNAGTEMLMIDGAASDASDRAEIHSHVHHNGMMSMQKVDHIEMEAGTEFVFAPGSYHLMLIDLHKALREGDVVRVQLFSGNKTLLDAELPVRSVLTEHHH